MIGKVISHYRIIEEIGRGGMGVIYKAEDTRLHRTVAIKLLPPELVRDSEARERFIREARAASALDHNNICTIHEIDETDEGQTFMVMACYEGETLRKKIIKKRLKKKEAIEYAIQIAEGLAKAHNWGIVHRDIKPANIFVTQDGVVKILDFGLVKLDGQAQLTKDHSTLGTVAYMSPEQLSGEEVDQRTDIWSLGVVLYEMLTGELPFRGDYEQAIIYAILNEEPEPIPLQNADVPPQLETIVNKAMAKDKERRLQTITEFLDSLQSLESEGEAAKSRKGEGYYPQKSPFSVKSALMTLLATIVILSAFYIIVKNIFSAEQAEKAIVVLPFQNLTADDSLAIWESGIQELLISDLSTSEELRVMDSNALSMLLKNLNRQDTVQSGMKLAETVTDKVDVESIVSGNILRAGKKIRLQVKIQDANSSEVVQSETLDGSTPDDFFLIADSLAARIRNFLEIKSLKKDATYFARHIAQTHSARAYRNYMLGIKSMKAFDYKSAQSFLSEAVQIDSNFIAAYIDLSNAYRNTREMDKAHYWHQRAYHKINDIPYKQQLLLEMQRAYLHKDPYESIRWAKKLAELEPQIRSTWYQLGIAYLRIDRYKQAIQSFKHAIALAKRWKVGWAPYYRGLGQAYEELGQFRQASQTYRDGLQYFPDDTFLLRNLAASSLALKDTATTNDCIQKLQAVGLDKGWKMSTVNSHLATLYRDAAIYLLKQKEPELANNCLEKYRKIYEEQGRPGEMILRNIALCYYYAGQWQKAVEILKDVLEDKPDYKSAQNNLAYILINQTIDVDEGIRIVRMALERDPDNPLYMDTQGLGYIKQGKFREAVQVLQKARDLYPYYNHDIYQHLQQALAAHNQ